MESYKDNPATNILAAGVTEEKLNAAIIKSGYPLQTKVALLLRDTFRIQEEWSFFDEKTNDIRTIDLLAERPLYDMEQRPAVPPILNLVIECKQSELPFIFFLSDQKLFVPNFPLVAGLGKDYINIISEAFNTMSEYSLLSAFSLQKDDFFIKHPTFANKFSKCERKSGGSDLILSGEETFKGIVYPLLKAMLHLKRAVKPINASFFACHVILGIAVLDAPMVGVEVTKDSHTSVLLPWVRVVKHETDAVPNFYHMKNMFAFDIVHKDFLGSYIVHHLLPFAQRLSELALKHQEVLAKTSAYVSDIRSINPDELERYLQPGH